MIGPGSDKKYRKGCQVSLVSQCTFIHEGFRIERMRGWNFQCVLQAAGYCPQQVGTLEQRNPNDTVNTFLARILLPAPGPFFISCAGLLKGPHTHLDCLWNLFSSEPLRLLAWQHRPGLGLLRLLHISQMWQKKILMNPIFLLDSYLMMSLFVIKPIDSLSKLVQEQRKQAEFFTLAKRNNSSDKK